jgi:hypothetical protein
LTNQKFCYAAQQSATGMYPMFELFMEGLQFLAKLRSIPFYDLINEFAISQRDKFL